MAAARVVIVTIVVCNCRRYKSIRKHNVNGRFRCMRIYVYIHVLVRDKSIKRRSFIHIASILHTLLLYFRHSLCFPGHNNTAYLYYLREHVKIRLS